MNSHEYLILITAAVFMITNLFGAAFTISRVYSKSVGRLSWPMASFYLRSFRYSDESRQRHSEEIQQFWIETIITYFENQETNDSRDATILIQFLWKHSDALTESSKQKELSFRAKIIAAEITREQNEIWDLNRVQRARAFVIEGISNFERDSAEEAVSLIKGIKNYELSLNG
jgi:hypothetical protein